uniref:Si:ch211-263p13.7 n=1 Tax=Electrophorus electricus TaxID=8005 RepID=A0A4W4F893_ELEEL
PSVSGSMFAEIIVQDRMGSGECGTRCGSVQSGLQEAGQSGLRFRGCCSQCPLTAARRGATGLLLAACVAWSYAWAAHYAKDTLTKLQSPFFIMWFCSVWNLFSFPLYYLGHVVGSQPRQQPCTQFRLEEDEDGGFSKVLLKVAAPFSLLHSASEYLHLLALHHISISDSSTVLCCSQAFIFLLSWIGLKDRFMGVRIVAAILSITGIVMMSYADGFHSDSITGVALGVGSASTSAFYKVQITHTFNGFLVGLHSWFCALLYISHVESWPTPQHIPWDTLCLTASLLLAFNVLVNMREVLTYPTLISLGILFTIPASVAPHTSQVRMVARAIIAAGYLMLLLPEDWDERTAGWFRVLWHGHEESLMGEEIEADQPKPTVVAALP